MKVYCITIFEEIFKPYLENSIIGKAIKNKIISIDFFNPIEKVDKLKRIDDIPYGGGPGMVLKAKPILDCFLDIKKQIANDKNIKTIFFTPFGETFTQEKAKELSKYDSLIFICGRYEGVDDRVAEATDAIKLSIGDYTLTGGELPALVVLDAVSREIDGVLGNKDSLEDRRVAGSKVYTRPEKFEFNGKEYSVPEVLISGHHKKIDEFKALSNKTPEEQDDVKS